MQIFCILYKKVTRLKFFAGKFAQGTALPFDEVYVGEEVFAVEFFAEVCEAVGPGVEVRLVYLVNISGEDDLGAFSCSGYDCFDLMRGEVLGFIYDEEGVGEGAAADVGQW